MRVASNDILWYVADFETTSAEYYKKNGYTKVWLYSVCDSSAKIVNDGDSIDMFMEWCKKHCGSIVYFHNLKFDGSFIINYLYDNEFEWKEKILSHSPKGFSTLIGDMGEFYQIKVNFSSNMQIIFQDSLKIIPLKVKKIAESFNLPIEKEIIDYEDYTIDNKRLEYVHHDVQIVAMALRYFRNNGFTRMTIGSNSYHEFSDNEMHMNWLFPRLDRDWLVEWREAYRGGRSQVNPMYEGKVLHNVKRFDINSMYPFVMSRCPMPYGRPIKIIKPNTYLFELYDVDINFELKQGHFPTLLRKSGMFAKGDSYYLRTDGVENIKISNIDLELVKRHYNIYYLKFNEMYGFNTSTLIFNKFIDKYYSLKSKSTGGMKLLYKLIINNLYGKFGSKPRGKNKIPKIGDNGIYYEYSEEKDMSQYYLPVAIAVVSFAHRLIDDAIISTGFDKFVYCDTDSIHTLGTLPIKIIDQKELGKFKLEAIEDSAKYIRQKCYIDKENNTWKITCAGMPDSIKEFIINEYGDNVINVFKIGLSITKDTLDKNNKPIKLEYLKKEPKQVKGGTILVPVPFSLN